MTAGPMISLAAKLNDSNDEHVRAELAKIPAALEQVDRWIEEGVLGGDVLNAADYQIAPSDPPADGLRRPAAADRGAARRQACAARDP